MRNILWDILMIVIGIVLILFPGETMDICIKVIGIILLLGGAAGILLGFRGQGTYQVYTMGGAVTSIVAGIICLVQPQLIKSVLPLVMGIVILATGLFNIGNAINAKRAGASRWVVSLILALITVILGVVILLNLNGTADLLVTIIGVVFVYNGTSTLIMKILNRA